MDRQGHDQNAKLENARPPRHLTHRGFGRESEPLNGAGHTPMTAVVDEVFVIQDNDNEFMEVSLHDEDDDGGRKKQGDDVEEEHEMGV